MSALSEVVSIDSIDTINLGLLDGGDITTLGHVVPGTGLANIGQHRTQTAEPDLCISIPATSVLRPVSVSNFWTSSMPSPSSRIAPPVT